MKKSCGVNQFESEELKTREANGINFFPNLTASEPGGLMSRQEKVDVPAQAERANLLLLYLFFYYLGC